MTQTVPPEYRQLQDNYNSAVEKLQEIQASVKSSAQEVTNASGRNFDRTTDLSQRTEEQAASLEETSAAMEEISSTVKNNAENAQSGQQFGRQHTRGSRSWRPGGRPGDQRHGQDRGIVAQDFRHHRRDRRDRARRPTCSR